MNIHFEYPVEYPPIKINRSNTKIGSRKAPSIQSNYKGLKRPFKQRSHASKSSLLKFTPRGAVMSVDCLIIAVLVTTVPPPLRPARRK